MQILQAYQDTVHEVAYYMDLLAEHDQRFIEFATNFNTLNLKILWGINEK